MNNDYFPRVVQAIADNNYNVFAYFDDGSIKCLAMKDNHNKGIFQQLQDISVFKSALTVLNDSVAWDLSGKHDPTDCIDIDPFTVYEQPAVRESDFIEKVS